MCEWWTWVSGGYKEDRGFVRISSTGDEKKIAQAHEGHGSIGEKVFFIFFILFFILDEHGLQSGSIGNAARQTFPVFPLFFS